MEYFPKFVVCQKIDPSISKQGVYICQKQTSCIFSKCTSRISYFNLFISPKSPTCKTSHPPLPEKWCFLNAHLFPPPEIAFSRKHSYFIRVIFPKSRINLSTGCAFPNSQSFSSSQANQTKKSVACFQTTRMTMTRKKTLRTTTSGTTENQTLPLLPRVDSNCTNIACIYLDWFAFLIYCHSCASRRLVLPLWQFGSHLENKRTSSVVKTFQLFFLLIFLHFVMVFPPAESNPSNFPSPRPNCDFFMSFVMKMWLKRSFAQALFVFSPAKFHSDRSKARGHWRSVQISPRRSSAPPTPPSRVRSVCSGARWRGALLCNANNSEPKRRERKDVTGGLWTVLFLDDVGSAQSVCREMLNCIWK